MDASDRPAVDQLYTLTKRRKRLGSGHQRGGRRERVTPEEAQRIQDEARARGVWIMRFVTYEHTGKFIARAHRADPHGGKWLPGVLAADTLDELRTMLPRGLTRHDRTAVMSAETIE